ncbi:DUF814 domain-containing protein [Candidatus Micrarchaeota archaeon]|nr:DUF814 domain-containing protein [Candidatus Micrarchaeota archaeon]
MKIRYDVRKNPFENAASYFEEAKKMRRKIGGMEKAMRKTQEEMEELESKEAAQAKTMQPRIKREKKPHEKFRYFFTSSGLLAIGGRDAKQNDAIVARHMEEEDLFFHADIQGGSVVVLKGGEKASAQDGREAAQFAACYSNAWKNKNAAVDAYCVKPVQISKYAQGGYVGKGGYAIEGERLWFRGTALELVIGLDGQGNAAVQPALCKKRLENEALLVSGEMEKGKAAAQLAKMLSARVDEILQVLPSGEFKISKRQ